MRTYSELVMLPTFEDRFEYLRLDGDVGLETFGHSRYINQTFYHSSEWRNIRNHVIARDEGCDLGIADRIISRGLVLVHHMNPVDEDSILHYEDILVDPEYLITVSKSTHNAIHYGDASLLLDTNPIERFLGDTKLW